MSGKQSRLLQTNNTSPSVADALRASGFTLQERRREREAVQAEREVRDDVLLRAVSLQFALGVLRTEEQRSGVADGENLDRLNDASRRETTSVFADGEKTFL